MAAHNHRTENMQCHSPSSWQPITIEQNMQCHSPSLWQPITTEQNMQCHSPSSWQPITTEQKLQCHSPSLWQPITTCLARRIISGNFLLIERTIGSFFSSAEDALLHSFLSSSSANSMSEEKDYFPTMEAKN